MSGIATTKAQANIELKKLRKERGVRKQDLVDSAVVSSLNQSLTIISDQLYETPTHFLLELIQNADDNNYPPKTLATSPALHLHLYEKDGMRFFRTDCNESGFSFAQLDALTQVGKSTKTSTSSGRKGHIGEKGIGFKSVFRVADVVHVASGFYEFKLDRNQPLGMILPIISSFPPTDRVAAHTQFLLHLRDQDAYEQIQREVENIEPELLMFLRKLGTLRVCTSDTDIVYRRHVQDSDEDFGGETTTISIRDNMKNKKVMKKTKYIVQRHTVHDLPPESRREGIVDSEVIVAFPIKSLTEPMVKSQKAFAFLPIGNCGFQFLIHADFLLVASRESIQYRLEWNNALWRGIKAAFLKAVERFALAADEDGRGLCYAWPQYLKYAPGYSTFWDTLHEDILQDLSGQDILESIDESASLQRPDTLFWVHPRFRFNDDALFDLPSIRESHLSFNYDNYGDVVDNLKRIGVRDLSIRHLYNEFKRWIAEKGVDAIKAKSRAWHRRISTLFYDDELRDEIRKLPIIPLRDGSWVKANRKRLYLAKDKDEHVPNGVDILIVDDEASQDCKRRRFFKFLGIEEYEPEQVCDLILELHGDFALNISDRADDDLVKDVAYLFKHRSTLSKSGVPAMWFVVNKLGKRLLRQSGIYFVDPTLKPSLVKKYKDTPGNPFEVLDEKYESVICGEDEVILNDFHKWLSKSPCSSFQAEPRLIRHGSLSSEWNFLKTKNKIDLLRAAKFYLDKGNGLGWFRAEVSKLQKRVLGGNKIVRLARRQRHWIGPTAAGPRASRYAATTTNERTRDKMRGRGLLLGRNLRRGIIRIIIGIIQSI